MGGAIVSRHEPEGMRVLSDIYWRTLLSIATLLVLSALVYGVWGLLRVLDDLNSVVRVSAPPPPAINRGVLNATMEGFETRSTQFELLKTKPGEIIHDPSK